MTSEWPLIKVEECAADEPYSTQIGPFGDNIRAKMYTRSGVPVLRGTNVRSGRFNDDDFVFISEADAERLKIYECKPDDIVLVHKGTIGRVGIIPHRTKYKKYIIGNSMMKVRCDRKKVLPLFLYYWLVSEEAQNYFYNRISQVGVPQLQHPLTTLRQATFRCPPIEVQERTVHILGSLDEKIELNAQMNKTLESLARSIFRSWFIDFDPVRAKAEGKQPFGMDEETAALFPSEFEDSERGEIPREWTVKAIKDIADINSWTLSKKDDLSRIDYVEISEVVNGDISSVQTFIRGEEPSRARRRLRHGDTVMSTVRPDRGSYFLCLSPPESLVASTGFAVITTKSVPWSFIYLAMTQPSIFEYLGQQADGGAYPSIRPEIIENIHVPQPSQPEVLKAFHKTVSPLLELANNKRRQSKTLSQLRDTVLPKLLSGEIQIDAARGAEA